MNEKQQYGLLWNEIELSISFQADCSEVYKAIIGEALTHIEVKTGERLPIMKTGYRSVFLPLREVQERGGVVALVLGWLEDAARAREWKEYVGGKMQYCVFGR